MIKKVLIAFVLILVINLPTSAFSRLIHENQYRIQPVPDFDLDFLIRYRRLIDNKTRDAFKKLRTDEEKTVFIEKFWKERDPDPATEVNEFEAQYDQKISDIENEIFLTDPDLSQFTFRNNGGLNGDPAWVYLIFGFPTIKADLLNANHVDELMVWIYVDTRGGVYRFLFYKDHGGNFRLFNYYLGYLEDRLAKISRFYTGFNDVQSLNDTYDEIRSSPYGDLFLSALYEFSSYGTYPDSELEPPLPAAIVAKKSGLHIAGLPGTLPPEQYLFSDNYHSLIPALFRIGNNKDDNQPLSYVMLNPSDIDWRVIKDGDKEKVEAYLRLDLTFIRKSDRKSFLYISLVRLVTAPDEAKKNNTFTVVIKKIDQPLVYKTQIKGLSELPAGDYRVDVYLRNEFTRKYFSDVVDYSR